MSDEAGAAPVPAAGSGKRPMSFPLKVFLGAFGFFGSSALVYLLFFQPRPSGVRPAQVVSQPEAVVALTVPGGVAPALAAADYGDERPANKPAAPAAALAASGPQPIPTVTAPTVSGIGSGGEARESSSDGTSQFASPPITTATENAPARRSDAPATGADGGYGDEIAGLAPDTANALASGRPVSAPRDKDALPEQLYASIVPRRKIEPKPLPTPAGDPDATADGGATGRRPGSVANRVPPKGTVLGGGRAEAAEAYAPYGRVLKCELVFAVDSIDTEAGNIIALTTEPLIYNGRVVIPTHTEVFGKPAKAIYETPDSGRILDSGVWRLVLPAQPGLAPGREIVVKARAHARRESATEGSGRVRSWEADMDGSPGLYGRAITTRSQSEIKARLLNLIAGAIPRALETIKDREPSAGIAGLVGGRENAPTGRNLGIDIVGGAMQADLELQATRVAEAIGKQGTYVQINGGVPFYLFVEETVLPADAAAGREALRLDPSRNANRDLELMQRALPRTPNSNPARK